MAEQSNGVKSDWTKENEFRHSGDFELSSIPDNKKVLFCRFKKEADELSKLTGLKSISFTIYCLFHQNHFLTAGIFIRCQLV